MPPHQLPRREFVAMLAGSVPAVGFDWSALPTATARRDGRADYDAIVIGSGLGGLACAAAFARQGFRPVVLEQHDKPGATPRLSAPGIVSVDADFEHSAAVFSPDGKEVFWCARRNVYSDQPADPTQRLLFMRETDGRWSDPQVAPFTAHLDIPVQRRSGR